MSTDCLIEPDSYDLIVLGTGLPESILAAAAAGSGHTVLHLDSLDFYGAHWASLPLSQFSSWAASGGSFVVPLAAGTHSGTGSSAVEQDRGEFALPNGSAQLTGVDPGTVIDGEQITDGPVDEDGHILTSDVVSEGREATGARDLNDLGLMAIKMDYEQSIYSEVKVVEYEGVSLGASRYYNIDLCGPKLCFCGSNLINLLIRSGATNYVEFKGVEASYIWTATGLSAVPSSRADIFKDSSLSLPDKRYLMRFFKLVTEYASGENLSSGAISPEDLEIPFVDFMQLQHLPTSIQSIILYAIALVDHEQHGGIEDPTRLLKTQDGLMKLALYLSSVARFPNAPGAFLYPFYGQGELPQAFCRSAAVNGALYVLRRPISALLVNKDTNEYKGVQTLQGQLLFSKKLVVGPGVMPRSGGEDGLPLSARLDTQSDVNAGIASSSRTATASFSEGDCIQVARCVCITDKSLFEGQNSLLIIFPPRSVRESLSTVIRALQLSSGTSVCPEGKYIVQLSTICSTPGEGLEAIKAATNALFSQQEDSNVENSGSDGDVDVNSKPKLLWSVSYIQNLHTAAENMAISGAAVCKVPDGALDFEGVLASTEKVFGELFPEKDFFPRVVEAEENGADELEME